MIQKTYAQINREIQALQAHAEKLRAAELQAVIAKLNETIAKHGLKAEDLRFAGTEFSSGAPARSSRETASSSSRAASSATGAKYGDGQGHSWGGRGPRPAWLREALSKGRTLESFAVSGTNPSDPAPATQGRPSGNSKANENSGAKSPLPPLYSHPKTNQTWGGRGPKPAWLKQGLKKRGASLNDFLISARESGGDVKEATGPAASESPASSPSPRTAKSAATLQSNGSKNKSLAEKISSRTKASSPAAATPTEVPAPAPATPVAAAKKPTGKKAPAKKSSETTAPLKPAKTAAKKDGTSKASESAEAPVSATPAVAAKKVTPKSPVKNVAKGPKKPSMKKAAPANGRVAPSMTPPADTSPASLDAAAATPPVQESGPADGPSPIPGV